MEIEKKGREQMEERRERERLREKNEKKRNVHGKNRNLHTNGKWEELSEGKERRKWGDTIKRSTKEMGNEKNS